MSTDSPATPVCGATYCSDGNAGGHAGVEYSECGRPRGHEPPCRRRPTEADLLSDQDKEILRRIKESLARVEPYLKKMRQAEREGRMWANRCNCPEFCFFHTPLAGAKS